MMLHKYIIIFSSVLLACSQAETTPPDNLITEDLMVELVVQMELNQAIYKLKFANKDSVDYQFLTNQTFDKLNVTQEQFNNSVAYYAQLPKTMELIYSRAIIQLTQAQAKTQSTNKD